MNMSDDELLREFARSNHQAAFATLVERHLDLVYSVARRQVQSPHLAEEVAQSVFTDLARAAAKFPTGTPIVAWLHVVSRRTAIDVVRREARRRARESAAVLANIDSSATAMPSSSSWATIEPLLDEAVGTLAPPDRTAILLRFFENRSLREIGGALGLSEDAAQKRVARALERLHTFLVRRGVVVTSAGLATSLSANALHVAPSGLGAVISAAAATTMTSVAVSGTHALVMTTLQKSLAAGVLAVTTGFGVFEASVLQRQHHELEQLARRSSQLAASLDQTHTVNAALATQLASVEKQIDARLAQARASMASSGHDAALERQIEAWLQGAAKLRDFFATRRDLATPELSLLSEKHWAEVASHPGFQSGIASESDLLRAAARARALAADQVSGRIQRALVAYVKSYGDVLPDDFSQVLPYFDPPLTLDTLARYRLVHSGKVSDVAERERNNRLVTHRWLVDPTQDSEIAIGLMGWSVHQPNAGRPAPLRPAP
jgi:RNA polymerase sigma factor (sigma-70 family)